MSRRLEGVALRCARRSLMDSFEVEGGTCYAE